MFHQDLAILLLGLTPPVGAIPVEDWEEEALIRLCASYLGHAPSAPLKAEEREERFAERPISERLVMTGDVNSTARRTQGILGMRIHFGF